MKNSGINITTFGQGWGNGGRVSQTDLIKIYNQSKIILNLSSNSKDKKLQIKGRDFEVPGCGSLLLTEHSEMIKKYFIPGAEIITYSDIDNATKQIKYYLKYGNDLVKLSQGGYERAIKEHTYFKRFAKIKGLSLNAGME